MNDNKEGKDELTDFLSLISGIDSNAVPPEDAKDMQNGATYIPDEITILRRSGEKVKYLGNNEWEYKGKTIS